MHIASIGIDLGKTTFHLVALDDHGKVVIKKKFSRKQLLTYTENLQTSLITARKPFVSLDQRTKIRSVHSSVRRRQKERCVGKSF